jgi:hypothetical protein
MARRRQDDPAYNSRLNVKCYETFNDQVKQLADKENLTVSDYVRRLLSMIYEADRKKAKELKSNRNTIKCVVCGTRYKIKN